MNSCGGSGVPPLYCGSGGSWLVPAQQCVPVWERNPKITPPWHCCARAAASETYKCPGISRIVNPFPFMSSHFKPFSSITKPFPALTSNF